MARKMDRAHQQALMKEFLDAQGVGMMRKIVTFIENHWDDEDKDLRRDAHKLLSKYFDSYIPKKQVIETTTEVKILDDRINRAVDVITVDAHKRIEVEEATIIDPSEARSIKNGRK